MAVDPRGGAEAGRYPKAEELETHGRYPLSSYLRRAGTLTEFTLAYKSWQETERDPDGPARRLREFSQAMPPTSPQPE